MSARGQSRPLRDIERYEQKYLVSPREAERVRRLIRPYCLPDSATRNGPYQVLSLYLDGDHLPLYRATRANESARLKLRARTYLGDAVYLEIKRKIRGMIWKSRARVTATAWSALFEQRSTLRRDQRALLKGLSELELDTYHEFIHWRDRHQARPQVWVRYNREGYQSLEESYARVTFDTQVCGALPQGYALPSPELPRPLHWRHLDYSDKLKSRAADVIIELKCERSVPDWMSELSRHLDARSVGVSKYGLAIEQLLPGYALRQRDALARLTAPVGSSVIQRRGQR